MDTVTVKLELDREHVEELVQDLLLDWLKTINISLQSSFEKSQLWRHDIADIRADIRTREAILEVLRYCNTRNDYEEICGKYYIPFPEEWGILC